MGIDLFIDHGLPDPALKREALHTQGLDALRGVVQTLGPVPKAVADAPPQTRPLAQSSTP